MMELFVVIQRKDSFKPYYKWNSFNTGRTRSSPILDSIVLNLIITGMPSILRVKHEMLNEEIVVF